MLAAQLNHLYHLLFKAREVGENAGGDHEDELVDVDHKLTEILVFEVVKH